MFKMTSRLLVSAAAASMALAPVAAQANTRAADSAPIYTTSEAQPGIGRSAEGENVRGAPGILVAILGAAAVIAGIAILASEDDEDTDENQSPGT